MALCILHANIFVCSTRTMYNIFYLFREFRQTRSYKKNLLTYLVTKKIYISNTFVLIFFMHWDIIDITEKYEENIYVFTLVHINTVYPDQVTTCRWMPFDTENPRTQFLNKF